MRILNHSLLLLTLSFILFSCQKQSDIEQILQNIDTYSVKLENQHRWSVMSTTGEVLIADAFVSAPTVSFNGIFSVYDSIGISFHHLSSPNSYTSINGLKGLRYAGAPAHGLIPVTRPDSPIEIVDTLGNSLFLLNNINGKNFTASGPFFSDKLLIVREKKSLKWGAINTSGNIAIEPLYLSLTLFNCNHALATLSANQTVIVDTQGNEVKLPEGWIPYSGNFVYNHAILINPHTGSRCVTDTKGNLIKFPSSHVPVAIGKSGTLCIDNDGAYFLHSFSGKETQLSGWEIAMPVPCSKLLVGKNKNNWIITESKGKTLYQAPDSCSITPLLGSKSYLIFSNNHESFLLSDKYQKINSLRIAKLEQRIYMNDILLSDRDEDHIEFNNADPGDELPDWMEPDTLTTE